MSTTSGRKVRVLIIDDSSFMRMAIRSLLSHDPEIEVVGTATDGLDGVEKAAILKPDIITMDVEMPRMDGIAAVRQIMSSSPTRVIMVSTLTREGAGATFDALEAGAFDYVPKSASDAPDARATFQADLLRKVKEAAGSIVSRTAVSPPPTSPPAVESIRSAPPSRRVGYVCIGASTGGPTAVQEVLSRLPATFPHPIVVAIHMPKAFTGPFAQRLNGKCPLQIREAAEGDHLRPGVVLLAPGGEHLTLVRHPSGIAVRLAPPGLYPRHNYIPSVDLMFGSLAESADRPVMGVILTGMGKDGFEGMQRLKSRGGITVVQDEATSTIFGMPRACIEGGVADIILPLGEIGPAIGQTAG